MKSSELVERLYRQVEMVHEARIEAANCKRQAAEFKQALELAEIMAISSGPKELTIGGNADSRKVLTKEYLSNEDSVINAGTELDKAEARLIDAEMEYEHQRDIWLAIRLEIRLMAAELEYLSETPDMVEAF